MLSATCTGICVARVPGFLLGSKDFFLNLGFMTSFGKYVLRLGDFLWYYMHVFLEHGHRIFARFYGLGTPIALHPLYLSKQYHCPRSLAHSAN